MPRHSARQEPTRSTTIYDVAHRAGVSIATVSRVIQRPGIVSAPTRAKVLRAIDELAYVPRAAARNLSRRRHDAVGIVLPAHEGPYAAGLITGFEAAATAMGQAVSVIRAPNATYPSAVTRRFATRVDGFVVVDGAGLPESVVVSLARTMPVIILGGVALPGTEAVRAECRGSANLLTRHLFNHGRRNLLFVGDPHHSHDIGERYAGFVAAHRGRRLDPAEPVVTGVAESHGREFARRLLDRTDRGDWPDALVCATDEVALAVMLELRRAGVVVPTDLAVVGWDDFMAARYIEPALTTVRQPVRELGSFAARRLGERLSGAPQATQDHEVASQPMIRQSCGCLP